MSYDFTNETVNNLKKIIDEYSNKKILPFKKYVLYRRYLKSIDPDSMSLKLQEIYKNKWDQKYLDVCRKNKDAVYSDTMTSVQGLLNSYYTELKIGKNKEIENEIIKYKNNMNLKKFSFSENVMFNMYDDINEYPEFEKLLVNNNIVTEFISKYHTIGNYIPVPRYFNKNRSGYNKKSSINKDMWDLTLLKIIEYFNYKKISDEEKMITTLRNLLHIDKKESEIIDYTKKWLDQYKTKKEFIDKNYLNPYVDKKYEIKKEFLDIHTWDNPTPNNHIKYFELITSAIDGRAQLIMNDKNKD